MKLLHLVFNRVGQGSYWRAYHFGRVLAQRGHSVTLMATSPRRRVGIVTRQVEGMTLVETPDLFSGPLRSGWDAWNTLNRLGWMSQRQFDLVYAIEARPTVIYPALYLQRRRQTPLVLDWADWFGRGGSVEERPNPLVRAILTPIETYYEEHFRRRADASTAICTTLYEKARRLGVEAETIRIIPNGCDPALLPPVAIETARHQAGLAQEAFIIGYVGSIFRRDAALMVNAFDQFVALLPEASRRAIQLLVVGYCPIDLRRLALHPDQVRQTGPVSAEQLYVNLAACNVFWLPLSNTPANRGRWPYKLNDYLALGRPTVATAVGDVAPLFAEEPVGLLCPDQPVPLAEQTLRLYHDPALRLQMGQRARQVAATRFNWERLTDELEILYRLAQTRRTAHQRK